MLQALFTCPLVRLYVALGKPERRGESVACEAIVVDKPRLLTGGSAETPVGGRLAGACGRGADGQAVHRCKGKGIYVDTWA